MSVQAANKANRWDDIAYRRIDGVRFDQSTSKATVTFRDRSVVSIDPVQLLPDGIEDPEFWRIAANEIELVVPYKDGWIEIPWDVIRRETDADYAAHWAAASRQAGGTRSA
jgi:hypothetical protein